MLRVYILLVAISIPVFCFADTIELKNGKIYEGKIVEETADQIKFDAGIGVVVTYFKDELKGYTRSDAKQGEAGLPMVFTMDELTPEQRKEVEEHYIPTKTFKLDLSSGDTRFKERPLSAKELTDSAYKLFKNGLIQEALAKVQEAIGSDKDYLPAYRVKADILQETGSPEQSIPLYDKVLEKDPDNDLVYMNRGYAYGRLNQFDRAIEDYNKALELNPESLNAISARASAYAKIGRMELAKKDYENLLNFEQEQSNFGLGNVAAYYHKWEEALSYYDKTIAVSPDFGPAYLMKGQVLLQLDRKQEAIEALKKAKSLGIAIGPDLEQVIQ